MDLIKVFIDGMEKDVYGLFYLYEGKYYFIYTEREIDENNYVNLYMTQVGKETVNTATGVVNTGNMVAVEINDLEEQKRIKNSISYIVEDKKNNTVNPEIQYLPITMLTNLKIVSKKRFKLLKTILEQNFKVSFTEELKQTVGDTNQLQSAQIMEKMEEPTLEQIVPVQITPQLDTNALQTPVEQVPEQPFETLQQPLSEAQSLNNISNQEEDINDNVIIDYKTKYFEEDQKNKELQAQIELLTQKLNEIKQIIE